MLPNELPGCVPWLRRRGSSRMHSRPAAITALRLFLGKIFVVEDIRRGANQFEADAQFTLIADREQFTAIHHSFMGRAMVLVVDHFINSTFQHRLSGQKHFGVLAGLAAMAPLFVSAGHQGPVEFFARGGSGQLSGVHFFVILTGVLWLWLKKLIFLDAYRLNIRVAGSSQMYAMLTNTSGFCRCSLRFQNTPLA